MKAAIGNKSLGKLTIGKKLIGSFLVIALLLALTGAIAAYYLNQINVVGTDLIERRAVILSNILKIQNNISEENNSLRGFIITKDPVFITELKDTSDAAARLINETRQLSTIAELKEGLAELERKNREFQQKYNQLLQMVQDKHPSDKINQYFVSEVLPLGEQLAPMAENLANFQFKSMDEASKRNSRLVDTANANVAAISIIAVILSLVIGYVVSRLISRPIIAIAGAAERIASGDLTAEVIRVNNKDELGVMAQAFNQMTARLRSLVGQISTSSEHVASASEELTASAEQSSQASEAVTIIIQEVSAHAEMQSQNVNESVQAMNEVSAGIQQIASSAHTTSSLSKDAAQKAMDGNQSIILTVKQMDSIHQTMNHLSTAVSEMEQHSEEIENIVKVISDIAAQTNLLSLNAGIEAARAGEHGRGFAVVAAEVRKLAEQSSESAGQIAELAASIRNRTHHVVETTKHGVHEVSEGLQVAQTAGLLFEEIKQDVDEVSNQVQEISAASQQISAITEQVVHSMGNIALGSRTVVSQTQNAAASTEEQLASMEEIATSSSSLSRMAEDLRSLVGNFKV